MSDKEIVKIKGKMSALKEASMFEKPKLAEGVVGDLLEIVEGFERRLQKIEGVLEMEMGGCNGK